MRAVLLLAFLLSIAYPAAVLPQASTTVADAAPKSRNFVSVRLPRGVIVDLPRNWVALTANTRTTLDAVVEAWQSDHGDETLSEFPFAANLYDDQGKVLALFNIRYYPSMDISQAEAAAMTPENISEIDTAVRTGLLQSAANSGMTLLSWTGTKPTRLGKTVAFLTEYRRMGHADEGAYRVRLVRVLEGARSFTVTVSYQERGEVLLRPICDRIISSIRAD